MPNWVLVAIGGACGSLGRYATQLFFARLVPTFPLGTTLVNLLGCFVIGMVAPLLGKLPAQTPAFVVVGILGGFTTMSSFSLDVVNLYFQERPAAAALYWALGAIGCITACAFGSFAGVSLAKVQGFLG